MGTPPMFGRDPDQVEREVARWAAGFEEKAQAYGRMSKRVSGISVTERTDDGAVRVTVDSSGNVTDLALSERARQYVPSQLSESILSCMRKAQARLGDQVEDVMRATLGEDDPFAEQVASGFRDRFPGQQDDRRDNRGRR